MTNNPGETRQHIKGIQTMTTRLLTETIHKGINSEAAMLDGPAADPEAHAYLHQSATSGRINAGFLEDQHDERHPQYVLAYWHQTIVEHLGHYRTYQVTLDSAAAYISSHLTDLANDDTFEFETMAKEIQACHAHLEEVLTEGDRDDKGAPCPSCGGPALVKDWGETVGHDLWVCPSAGCHQTWTEHDYRQRVEGIYVGVADKLTLVDMAERIRVPYSTLRRWASEQRKQRVGRPPEVSPPLIKPVGKFDGRNLYNVQDTLTVRDRLANTEGVVS